MITIDEARAQGAAFFMASDNSPLVSVAVVLRERGKEYQRAADDASLCESMGKKVTIMPVGVIENGMVVYGRDEARVIRVIKNQGDITLHVNDMGQSNYLNFITSTSPVVVFC